MAPSPRTMLVALRKRPAHERRILAAAVYLTSAFVILGLWVTSLEGTLSSITNSPLAALEPAATPETSPAPDGAKSNVAPQPAAPLAALKDALSGTIAASRQLIAEFKRAESIPATPTGESKGIAPPAESAPPPPVKTSITPLPEPTVNRAPAAEPAPGEVIAGAAAALPYSSYAASRLLSEPFDPGMIAPEAAGQQSRISAVITYNLAELRRTAGDIYEYFTQ